MPVPKMFLVQPSRTPWLPQNLQVQFFSATHKICFEKLHKAKYTIEYPHDVTHVESYGGLYRGNFPETVFYTDLKSRVQGRDLDANVQKFYSLFEALIDRRIRACGLD